MRRRYYVIHTMNKSCYKMHAFILKIYYVSGNYIKSKYTCYICISWFYYFYVF